ncbi:MAG: hypothetical protein A2Y00_08980 [Omnitrophica WOR_2 bacterium GWF2_43_52]|nr:MAG: hypothetical protein A2062_07225 [Omnitrophica WOR_2 bacterium GWA2_44_7]OGX14352.1 MAG: hypothetical protein A2Y01_06625 [Omnitrophica WOR_2 bacterium GWC2_44_8]OGX21699.1 MAG: hypothetical protein A2Y00_08980 [Omnitrophica WOR_2 bacterium GWF2_43_52]OGX52892.1 MAG: hypothetical protein A2460_03725 [Omnitrophica WOR_2 bacterium RIFOXYC2_FULL_43_9]HAH19976.1 hypothetical protein [Candidatus Omnitrophota bacterium]
MEKNYVKTGLVILTSIVLGVFIGMGVMALQVKHGAVNTLFEQQKEINEAFGKLEERLVTLEKQGDDFSSTLKKLRSELPQRPPPEDYAKVYPIDIAHSPILGQKDAPITIVEFVDFQCPFCARFHPLILEAVKLYPDKVKAVLKNFPLPFHQQAKSAAAAAFAAGEQGKYWEMANELLKNHTDLSEKRFKELAKGLGLNVAKFLKDYSEKKAIWSDYIEKDMKLGGKVEVRGTPTIYINGCKTRARDLESFKKAIEESLSIKKQ